MKDREIEELMERISDLQNKEVSNNFWEGDDYDELEASSESDTEYEASTSSGHQKILCYDCDLCDFKTKHEVGLKIHISERHIPKYEECNLYFDNSEKLERHKAADVSLVNLDETNDEEHDLQVKHYQ